MSRPCQLERAFELARSGQCQSIDDIKKKLLYEGLGTEQIDGPVLRRLGGEDHVKDVFPTPSVGPLQSALPWLGPRAAGVAERGAGRLAEQLLHFFGRHALL